MKMNTISSPQHPSQPIGPKGRMLTQDVRRGWNWTRNRPSGGHYCVRICRLGFDRDWEVDELAIRQRFEALAPVLDERGLRRLAAAEAIAAGRGGVSAVMRATDLTRSTIGHGLGELRAGQLQDVDRVRRPGVRTQAAERDGCAPAQ